MNLQDVKTLEDIVNYSEGLANDIEAGITDDNGICNAELISEFAIHCATLAKDRMISKIKNIEKEAKSDLKKWDGTDTTYGDSGRNSADVNYGISEACYLLL